MQVNATINETIRSLNEGDTIVLQAEGMKKARTVVVQKSHACESTNTLWIGTTGPRGWSEFTRQMKGGCLCASDVYGTYWRSTMMQPPKALTLLEVIARA